MYFSPAAAPNAAALAAALPAGPAWAAVCAQEPSVPSFCHSIITDADVDSASAEDLRVPAPSFRLLPSPSPRQLEASTKGCCLLLQDLLQSCSHWGRRIVEDVYYKIRQAQALVD